MEGGQGKNENFAESRNFIKSARSPSSVWGYEMSPIKAKSIWYIPGFKLLVRHEVMYASAFSFFKNQRARTVAIRTLKAVIVQIAMRCS